MCQYAGDSEQSLFTPPRHFNLAVVGYFFPRRGSGQGTPGSPRRTFPVSCCSAGALLAELCCDAKVMQGVAKTDTTIKARRVVFIGSFSEVGLVSTATKQYLGKCPAPTTIVLFRRKTSLGYQSNVLTGCRQGSSIPATSCSFQSSEAPTAAKRVANNS